MSDIRFNRWLHQSGTGGVYQDSSGRVGIGTSVPTTALDVQSGTIKIGSNTLSSSGVSTFTTVNATTVNTTSLVGVATAGITTVYTNSFNGGQLGGSRNMIINGSMVVSQRGFTGTAGTTTDGGFPVDRFKLSQNNSAAVSAGQTSMNSTVGGAAYADGFQNALILRVTTAQSSLSAGNFQIVQQNIEGYNLQGIKKGTANAQPVTLSFWVRSNTIGTYIVDIHDNDNGRSCSRSYSINAANTWEKKTLTYPADTTGVFDNDGNLSVYLNWWLASGTNYTSGTLQTSWGAITDANRAVGQINLLATVNNEFWLTGVQLEVGDRATEFERRSYGDELRLCQRYYYELGGTVVYQYITCTASGSTSLARGAYLHPVPMRANPAFSHTGASTFALEGSSGYHVCTDLSQIFGSNQHAQIAPIASGLLTNGYSYVFLTNNNINARLRWNAEL